MCVCTQAIQFCSGNERCRPSAWVPCTQSHLCRLTAFKASDVTMICACPKAHCETQHHHTAVGEVSDDQQQFCCGLTDLPLCQWHGEAQATTTVCELMQTGLPSMHGVWCAGTRWTSVRTSGSSTRRCGMSSWQGWKTASISPLTKSEPRDCRCSLLHYPTPFCMLFGCHAIHAF